MQLEDVQKVVNSEQFDDCMACRITGWYLFSVPTFERIV
jgi:hypothetical protein